MPLQIREEPIDRASELAEIPIAFVVESIFEVAQPEGGGEPRLTEVPLQTAWLKDYDALETQGPAHWPARFGTRNCSLLAAYDNDARVGGALIAFDSADVQMLTGRSDVAVIWDLRVHPDARRSGVGSALFRACENVTRAHGCRALLIETQNINVPACRFYARMGCTLHAVDRAAYPDLPDEIRLLWYRDLNTDA